MIDEDSNAHEENNFTEGEVHHTGEETHHVEGKIMEEEPSEDDDPMVLSYCYHLEETNNHDNDTILIDTGSMVSVFRDESMLVNMRNVSQVMRAITNGGYQDLKRRGILPGFFPV